MALKRAILHAGPAFQERFWKANGAGHAAGVGGFTPSGMPGASRPYLSSPLRPLLAPSHTKPEGKARTRYFSRQGGGRGSF